MRVLGEGWRGRLKLADVSYCMQNGNKILLYSTGHYIQYLVINHSGKEYEKNVYMCITESLYFIAEINTLFINYNFIKG